MKVFFFDQLLNTGTYYHYLVQFCGLVFIEVLLHNVIRIIGLHDGHDNKASRKILFLSIFHTSWVLLSRGTIFIPITYRGEENKLSSGHVSIQINVNKPRMDLPVR